MPSIDNTITDKSIEEIRQALTDYGFNKDFVELVIKSLKSKIDKEKIKIRIEISLY